MANRYRNRNYGRGYENRGSYGNRSSEYERSGSGYGEGRAGSSDYGSEYTDYDREKYSYGRRPLGRGMRGSQSREDYGSYNRGYDEDYSSGSYQGGRGSNYERGSRGSGYDRESYSGSDSMNEYGGGGTYGGYTDRSSYGRGYRNYSGNYPESEGGYDFERDDERGWLDKASDEVSSWLGDEEAARRRRLDARRQGSSHRGRGPRNYTRSDERIREDINDRLTESDYLDASDIEVEVTGGEVVLAGTVENRYAKRLAEDIAEDVTGVKNVENRLRVNQGFYGQRGSSLTNTTANNAVGTGMNTSMGMPDRVSGSTGTISTGTAQTGSIGTAGTDETAGTSGTTGQTTGRSRGKTA